MLYYHHMMMKQYFHSFINADIIYNSIIVIKSWSSKRAIIDYLLRILFTTDNDYTVGYLRRHISSYKPSTLCLLCQ